MRPQANDEMTTEEQVAFAWEYREHFAEVARHNLEETRRRYQRDTSGCYRNAWAELAHCVYVREAAE